MAGGQRKKGAARIFGHQNAVEAVRQTTEGCAELGVGFLTLYAFSTENWGRPQEEVNGLMQLLVSTIRSETKTLVKNNIKLATIGNTDQLPKSCQKELQEAKEITKNNSGMILNIALSYSGRWDILEATKKIARDCSENGINPEDIDEAYFSSQLSTNGVPDPELLIRTSGEMRISNFLLWQLAYTELYITDVLWPDFRKNHLHDAIYDFQKRERRFGKISDQVKFKSV